MTDESLMLCVKNGDLKKTAILYEKYKKMLYSFFLYKNNNDKGKSDDLVQQVFYRVIKYRYSYSEDRDFKTWLYSIAWNVQNQDYKLEGKTKDIKANYNVSEAYIQINDDHLVVRQALKFLSEAHREVLIMNKFWGMKYEEIAEINNCSVGLVKTRIFRAMKSLREIYFKIS